MPKSIDVFKIVFSYSLFNYFQISEVHLSTIDIATRMMEPDPCATSTSTDCADSPTSKKEDPHDNELQLFYHQILADNTYGKIEDHKNGVPIVHNNIDAGSELVEVSGELYCKSEIDNVNNFGVLGDVNYIQTSVQHNDTVNHKPLLTSMNNCEVDLKETTILGK